MAVCCSKPVKNSDLHPEKIHQKCFVFLLSQIMEFAIFSYFQSQKLCYRFLQYFGEKIVMQFRKCRGGGIFGFFRLSKVFRLSKLFRFYKVCSQSFPSREMEKRMTMAYRVLSFRVYTSTIRALCNNITILTLIFLSSLY